MGDSKIVSGKEVRAHPLHLFLIILLYGALLPWDFFGRAQTRVLESKIPPTCLHQQDRTMIKRCEEIIYCYSVILLSTAPLSCSLEQISNEVTFEVTFDAHVRYAQATSVN